MAKFKGMLKRFSEGYVRFVERQGFSVILLACVGVIAGTAVWTNQPMQTTAAPTPPTIDAASAAQLMQQSLNDVTTPAPAPTATVQVWQKPLSNVSVLQSFSASRLTQSVVSGLWRLHDAVDLRCAAGDPVSAMADGVVLEVDDKGLWGASITIDHGQNLHVQYSGMSLTAGLRAGDPVSAGQTIGFGGNTVVDETDLGPHLHLRITRDGAAINPLTLLNR